MIHGVSVMLYLLPVVAIIAVLQVLYWMPAGGRASASCWSLAWCSEGSGSLV